MRSRRDLLRAGGVALAVGLAGCAPTGPRDWAELSATLRGPFDPAAPDEVPVAVEATVSSVGSRETGLAGLELVALDADRRVLTIEDLPGVTYRDADLADRRLVRPTDDGGETIYRVGATFERTLACETVPAWLALRVERVWAGEDGRRPTDDEDESGGAAMPAARSGAGAGAVLLSAPPPPVRVTASRYRAGRPFPERIEPAHYERVSSHYSFGRPEARGEPALVPPRTPSPTATGTGTGEGRSGTPDGTATEARTTAGDATATPTRTDAGEDGA